MRLFVSLNNLICEAVNKFFGLFPAEAGVGDRFTVNALTDLLCTVFDVAFDHETLDQLLDIGILTATLHNPRSRICPTVSILRALLHTKTAALPLTFPYGTQKIVSSVTAVHLYVLTLVSVLSL